MYTTAVKNLRAQFFQWSQTIAIDELDAGIFEMLPGELFHVIEETGKGKRPAVRTV